MSVTFADSLAAEWHAAIDVLNPVIDVADQGEEPATALVTGCWATRRRARQGQMEFVDLRLEPRYPRSRDKGDLVVSTPGGARTWIETKWFWKTWLLGNGGKEKAAAYLLAPLDGYSGPSAAGDLRKLSSPLPPDITHVGQVLIGHARVEDDCVADLDNYAARLRLDSPPWASGREKWTSDRHGGYEYVLRTWIAERTEFAGWWETVRAEFTAVRE